MKFDAPMTAARLTQAVSLCLTAQFRLWTAGASFLLLLAVARAGLPLSEVVTFGWDAPTAYTPVSYNLYVSPDLMNWSLFTNCPGTNLSLSVPVPRSTAFFVITAVVPQMSTPTNFVFAESDFSRNVRVQLQPGPANFNAHK